LTDIKQGGNLPAVNMEFVNREAELHELDAAAKHGGLLVVYGRRRVGKTRLLRHWLDARGGLLQQLLDVSILTRELPFGESVRSTKRTLYRIQDPTMRFWFRVFSPHQSRWSTYAATDKRTLIHEHAASVFEDVCRARFPGAHRYWEGDIELDLVAPDPGGSEGLVVAEVKWRRLSAAERKKVLGELESKWSRCSLRTRHPNVRFDVLDMGSLAA
jgi:AAA+ ATPase superfamily predicted ATPase